MPTRRSLNKLEFKAHMSIHDLVDVKNEESPGLRYTKDRFGRKHALADAGGSLRVPRMKKTAANPSRNHRF